MVKNSPKMYILIVVGLLYDSNNHFICDFIKRNSGLLEMNMKTLLHFSLGTPILPSNCFSPFTATRRTQQKKHIRLTVLLNMVWAVVKRFFWSSVETHTFRRTDSGSSWGVYTVKQQCCGLLLYLLMPIKYNESCSIYGHIFLWRLGGENVVFVTKERSIVWAKKKKWKAGATKQKTWVFKKKKGLVLVPSSLRPYWVFVKLTPL